MDERLMKLHWHIVKTVELQKEDLRCVKVEMQLIFHSASTLHLCCPQFAAWVDAVVFVFSLEDEISFQTVYNYFLRLSSYRNTAEVPMVLVGTQGAPLLLTHLSCLDIASSTVELHTTLLHKGETTWI